MSCRLIAASLPIDPAGRAPETEVEAEDGTSASGIGRGSRIKVRIIEKVQGT